MIWLLFLVIAGLVIGMTAGSALPLWATLSPLSFGAGMVGLIIGLSLMMWVGIN